MRFTKDNILWSFHNDLPSAHCRGFMYDGIKKPSKKWVLCPKDWIICNDPKFLILPKSFTAPGGACLFCLSAFAGEPACSQAKKPSRKSGRLCARDWIRTSTSFRMPPPEDGASTNFATRAFFSSNVHEFTRSQILGPNS